MLDENKNIDQLFRDKLGNFEKTPPTFLWTNIQGKLNTRHKEQRMAMMKTVAIAAAIVLAFLAGWWMTNSTDPSVIPQNSVAEQRNIDSNVDSSVNKIASAPDILSDNSRKDASNTSALPPIANRSASPNHPSFATFAANTSFIDHANGLLSPKSGELVLFETEKDFLDKFQQNFKMVKKFTDWIAEVRKDSADVNEAKYKSITIDQFKDSYGSGALALNNSPKSKKGRWSLKAEFAPVFNSPVESKGQRGYFEYSVSENYKPQETVAENTISGGMIAGYKVGKRLVVKSGIVYNSIRQTTRNVDFMEVNSLFSAPGNATLAATPTGQVSLDKMATPYMKAELSSDYQLTNTAKYSVTNELKQDIEFIEIPVQATYKLVDSKFDIGLTGGVSTNILIGNKAVLTEAGERVGSGETTNMRGVVYSGAVGLEMGYEITNHITITVEPRFKHFINSLSTNKSVNYKPNQIGIVTGLTYSFN